jgi:serine/threonine protein kinase
MYNNWLLQAVENEIMMIRQLKHPNVVTYLGVEICDDMHANNHLNIFLEYVDGGSLRKLLQDCGPMTEEHTAYNTTQVRIFVFVIMNSYIYTELKLDASLSTSSSHNLLPISDHVVSSVHVLYADVCVYCD